MRWKDAYFMRLPNGEQGNFLKVNTGAEECQDMSAELEG